MLCSIYGDLNFGVTSIGGTVYDGSHGSTSIPLQPLTSLRRREHTNAPVASYWLYRVLDDGERPSCKGCWGRSLKCTIAVCLAVSFSLNC